MLSGHKLILTLVIISIIIGIFFIGLAGLLFFYGGIDRAKTRMLVESVTIGPEWQIFPLQPPLEVERVGQKIRMQPENVIDWVEPHGALLLNDGSRIKIEIELIDQNGGRHALVPISIGAGVGFGPARAEEGAGFAKNRQFVELCLRSSRPILAKKVDWYCWTGK